MTVKTILAAASGGTASAGAVELACRFARRFNAHVEGFHAKPDPLDLVKYDAAMGASILTDAFIKRFTADADASAAKVRSDFTAALQRHGLDLSRHAPNELPGQTGGSAVWHEEIGNGPTLVARRARFFDLVVLGRSERVIENPHSDTVEQTLLQSGRPVLLAPAKTSGAVGDSIALGWNGSAAAVRAMIGVLPFLVTAENVMVISIGERHQGSAKSALDYLAWHDVKAKHIHVPTVTGASAGQQLLSAARDEGADLLAMGGYGHTPWHEFLFGGATRDIVGVSLLPLLLTH